MVSWSWHSELRHLQLNMSTIMPWGPWAAGTLSTIENIIIMWHVRSSSNQVARPFALLARITGLPDTKSTFPSTKSDSFKSLVVSRSSRARFSSSRSNAGDPSGCIICWTNLLVSFTHASGEGRCEALKQQPATTPNKNIDDIGLLVINSDGAMEQTIRVGRGWF